MSIAMDVSAGAGVQQINVGVDDKITLDVDGAGGSVYPPYEGETEITPNDNEQTLNTAGRYIPSNIVIARIPQTEYAHITYDMNKNIRVW